MKLSLRATLVLASALIPAVAVLLATLAYGYLADRQVVRLAQQRIDAAFGQTAEHVTGYLRPVERLTRQVAVQVRTGALSREAPDVLETVMLEALRDNFNVAGIYVGFPDGGFFDVRRVPGPGGSQFRTKVIDTRGGRDVNLTWRQIDLTRVSDEADPADTYDPRQRPWFAQAVQQKALIWTAPYVFFTARKPGVTAAIPVAGPDGSLRAVVGIDLQLDALSRFLSELEDRLMVSTAIVGGDSSVIGAPKMPAMRADGDRLALPRMADLGGALALAEGPGARPAEGSFLGSRAVFREIDADGVRHQLVVERLPALDLPWALALAVREDAFAEGRRDLWLLGGAVALAMGLIGALIGLRLAAGVAGPMAVLRQNAEKVLAGDRKQFAAVRSPYAEIQETSIALMTAIQESRDKDPEKGSG